MKIKVFNIYQLFRLHISNSNLLSLIWLITFLEQIQNQNCAILFSLINFVLEIIDKQLVFIQMPIYFDRVHVENLFHFLNFVFNFIKNVGYLHNMMQVRILLVKTVWIHLTEAVLCSSLLANQVPDIFKLNQISEVKITQAQISLFTNWNFLWWIFRAHFWIIGWILARAEVALISPSSSP